MKTIPYGHQKIYKKDVEAVVRVLKSEWLTQGPKIREFEDALCKYTGAKYAVVVSSGTAALHLACLALGIKRNDEVITSPITFIASSNCILYCGGKPVFADVCKDTVCIDPRRIIEKVNNKTKAIIPVDFAGHPSDLEEIHRIAKKHGLAVIEDAAHALSAEYKGMKIGSSRYSDMTIFSFHPVKSITTGEGGAILADNKAYYERLIMLRQHGVTSEKRLFKNTTLDSGGWYYEMQFLGYNYRLTDMQCALGISQLKKLDGFIKRRKEIVNLYVKLFKDNEYFDLPEERSYVKSSWHLFPIKLKDKYKNKKMYIFQKLRDSGIGVQVHYIPVYLHPYYKNLGFKKGLCPVAEDYYDRTISIPLHPSLRNAQVRSVAGKIFKVFDEL